jgi:hypothetical protein
MTDAERELILAESQNILNTERLHGVEKYIVQAFGQSFGCGIYEDRIPMTGGDTIVYEMALKFGRADIVVFHVDGSASVIEVKDGTKGYNHVVAGIGQATLYAVQLASRKDAVKRVRRCLLWSSAGSHLLDGVIEETCEQAGVIPLPWPSMRQLVAIRKATERVVGGANRNGGTEEDRL